jgi:hypothetical protein
MDKLIPNAFTVMLVLISELISVGLLVMKQGNMGIIILENVEVIILIKLKFKS